MKPVVYCVENYRGTDTFYLVTNSGRYFLFQQDYKSGVHNYFSKGLRLDEALDFTKCKRNKAIYKTITKLPAFIKSAETENGIVVLERTMRRTKRLQLAS